MSETIAGRFMYSESDIIGSGAKGQVFRGTDLETGEPVAIKVLRQPREDWEKEASMLRSLDHANIVKFLGGATTQSKQYIVTELAERGSLLAELKKEGPMGERQAAEVVAQVLDGLAYLHEKRVIHRDIKAANVLMTQQGAVKLTDFGLATPCNPDAHNEELVGSVYWLAPETVLLQPHTEASDIWSVGCLCVELLTGNPPFYDRPTTNAMYHIGQSTTQFPIPRGISEECEDFLKCCCDRDPKKRASASELLNHQWIKRKPVEVCSLVTWTDNGLFSGKQHETELWLKAGGLKKVVEGLATVSTTDAFSIVSQIAHAASQTTAGSGSFFVALGDADFWSLDLALFGTLSNLSTLFCLCCEHQPATVPFYAPAEPKAVQMFLNSNHRPECVSALWKLVRRISGSSKDRDEALRKLQKSGIREIMKSLVEEVGLQAFTRSFNPPDGWSWVDEACGIVHSLSDDQSLCMGLTLEYLQAIAEVSRHECLNCLDLLFHTTQLAPVAVGDVLRIGIFLQIAYDDKFAYRVRVAAAACFPYLQKSPEAARELEDASASVPLLAHVLSMAPLHIRDPDLMVPIFCKLCERATTAAAFSKYSKFVHIMLRKIERARVRRDPSGEELFSAIHLTSLVFANAESPGLFVLLPDLTKHLALIVQSGGSLPPKPVNAAALLLSGIGAQAKLL